MTNSNGSDTQGSNKPNSGGRSGSTSTSTGTQQPKPVFQNPAQETTRSDDRKSTVKRRSK